MIPQNISREHVLEAIKEIKTTRVPYRRESTKFYLIYDEEHFPPKYVISLANKFANGRELEPSQFSGGYETNSFLRKLGFEIVEKSKQNNVRLHMHEIRSLVKKIQNKNIPCMHG